MTWATAVAAGAAVIGGITQKNAADKATKRASKSAAAELEFAQKQYDDWLEVFGPIQDNLSEYYNNLTPDYIAATGLQNVEMERAAALDRVNQSLAQRGLLGSGLEAAAITDIELETAQQKAQVRSEAPMKAAQQQLGFLTLGYGQNPAGTLQNTLGNRAATDRQYAINMQQASGQATANAISTAGTALSDYLANRPASTAPAPTAPVNTNYGPQG